MTPAIPPPRSDAPRGEVDAWVLTGRISPRRVVRSAGVDGDGQPLTSYPLVHPIAGSRPRTQWAVLLAAAPVRYRLLCVDLDAKGSSEAAAADATQFGELVSELGIEHLVCASGPTGGRHVWIGLRDALDAEAVRALAYAADVGTVDCCREHEPQNRTLLFPGRLPAGACPVPARV